MVYLLAINIKKEDNFDVYIQLRDKDMRLLCFFNLSHIEKFFEEKKINHLFSNTNISKIIENISIGQIYKLNYNK